MGRIWPRHSHRGRPLNAIVRRQLKISSTDGRSWISFDRRTYDSGYTGWAVEAVSTTSFGNTFSGGNNDLFLEHLDKFVAAFDQFVLDRSVSVRLTGTYDTVISIVGDASHVVLEFRIGAADHLSQKHAVCGAFEIDQERLSGIAVGLRELCN